MYIFKSIFEDVATSCNFVDNPKPCIKPNTKTIAIRFGALVENTFLKPSKFSKPLYITLNAITASIKYAFAVIPKFVAKINVKQWAIVKGNKFKNINILC